MPEPCFKYEFGWNLKLKKYVKSWIKQEKSGGYVLVGPSGCGKTTLFRMLYLRMDKVSYFMGDELLDQIYTELRSGQLYKKSFSDGFADNEDKDIFPDVRVLLLDDLDFVTGRGETTKELYRRLRACDGNGNGEEWLVICSFVERKRAVEFATEMGYEVIDVKEVKPNIRIVKEKMKECGMKLNKAQIRDLANAENMFDLRCRFRKIEAYER